MLAVTGILVANKPAGITSRKVVDRVAHLLRGSKVGHAGTLDPLATGVLVVCVGPATRLAENVQGLPKAYRTTIRLGAQSDTLDADGRIEMLTSPRIPSRSEIEEAVAPLSGVVSQMPPAYSAKKIQGKRAYDLARAGQILEMTPRPVRIDRITVIDFTWPHLELEIDCGGGTYIRSIARDIGDALGCGGYVETLIRTRIGPFLVEQTVDWGALSAESIDGYLRPALEAVPTLPRLVLTALEVEAVIQGKRLPVLELPGECDPSSTQIALLDPDGNLIAIGEPDFAHGWIQPRKVLVGNLV
jgi:tRNA pseudouridine55 synthase